MDLRLHDFCCEVTPLLLLFVFTIAPSLIHGYSVAITIFGSLFRNFSSTSLLFFIAYAYYWLSSFAVKMGIFPKLWKIGKAKIIPKRGDRDPKSYRPILLLLKSH